MCILLKFNYANFGVSNFSKVIEARKTIGGSSRRVKCQKM